MYPNFLTPLYHFHTLHRQTLTKRLLRGVFFTYFQKIQSLQLLVAVQVFISFFETAVFFI